MRLGHKEIFVSDPLRSMEFYRDVLGFEVETVQQGKFVWLKRDGRGLMLRPGRKAWAPEEYQQAADAEVFYTDDLKATMDQLQSRGLKFQGVDGSDKCPTFCDPDGNWFQLVNPNDH